jgi:hypothetical protein
MTFYAPDPFDFKEIVKGPLIASGETFRDSYKALTSTNKYRTSSYAAEEKPLPNFPTATVSAKKTGQIAATGASTAAEAAKIEADNLKKQKAILASSQSSDDNSLLATRKTTV